MNHQPELCAEPAAQCTRASRFAVIGNPIAHSLSPEIHQHFAQQFGITLNYEKILGQKTDVENLVSDFFKCGGTGLNITAPFKGLAFMMAECVTPRCRNAKSANTLWMHKGRLHADTTDGVGLIRDLSRHLLLRGAHVLLLGAGGVARSIIPALFEASISSLTVLNRTQARVSALQADFPFIQSGSPDTLASSYDLILHATPLASFEEALPTARFYYDLNYQRDGLTDFVAWAHQRGGRASDGIGMLVEQAAEAFFIWHGIMPNTQHVMDDLWARYRKKGRPASF